MQAASSSHARQDSTDRAISRILDQHMKGAPTAHSATAVNSNNEESKKENDQKVMNINLHHERNNPMGAT